MLVDVPAPLPDPLVELIAHRFRVLGEPARIKLLDALRSGPATVGELAGRLGLSQQNTSKHLGVLATAGLVERTRAGNSVVYAIGDPTAPFATALPRSKPSSPPSRHDPHQGDRGDASSVCTGLGGPCRQGVVVLVADAPASVVVRECVLTGVFGRSSGRGRGAASALR